MKHAYGCFLPDLTRFTVHPCIGPGHGRGVESHDSNRPSPPVQPNRQKMKQARHKQIRSVPVQGSYYHRREASASRLMFKSSL